MLILRRARIPLAVLPSELSVATADDDPIEPTRLCEVTITGDRIASVRDSVVAPHEPPDSAAVVVDLAGAMVFPALVDVHVHLDKAHTWVRAPNRSGTFAEALDVLWRDKVNWTADDLRRRADFALRCAWAHGTSLMRTHVDTGLPWAETSHTVMAELREAWRGRIELQTVPLCRIDQYSAAGGEKLADLALRFGACALGGMPVMSADLPRQLDHVMALARERGVGLDLHVDENGDPAAECLRAVAEAVLRTSFPHPVVCGHCCSLAVQETARQRSTIERVRAAGLRIISLPMCNLYLQDRRGADAFPRTPRWRGLTLVSDLLDAGVAVACASDNVRDAFYAYGDFDMLEVFTQTVRLAHLDSRLGDAVRAVTVSAAEIAGRPDAGRVVVGATARLVVTGANSFSELLSRPAMPRRLVDGERIESAEVPDFGSLG